MCWYILRQHASSSGSFTAQQPIRSASLDSPRSGNHPPSPITFDGRYQPAPKKQSRYEWRLADGSPPYRARHESGNIDLPTLSRAVHLPPRWRRPEGNSSAARVPMSATYQRGKNFYHLHVATPQQQIRIRMSLCLLQAIRPCFG